MAKPDSLDAAAPTEAAQEFATLDELLGKPSAEEVLTLALPGSDAVRRLRFRALSSDQYDDLLRKHPPTPEQKKNGLTANWDAFAPALVAATLIEPALTLQQARDLWKSPHWSSGELSQLFGTAQALCMAGFDVPKAENG